jgi:poly(3-hydroxybutyrate) depolymerase
VRAERLAALVAVLVAAGCAGSGSGSRAEDAAASAPPGGDATAGSSLDAGDGGPPGDPDAAVLGASRCTATATSVACAHDLLRLGDSVGMRSVAFQTPVGAPPPSGWPAVIYFQGSFVRAEGAFSGRAGDAFGIYRLALTVQALLDGGYAVVAPAASGDGTLFWETNIPPYATDWSGSPDDTLMQNLFRALAAGEFGALDPSRLYAMGISSGGFMTSRMAVSYRGRFRALADVAGSYATCSAVCLVPTPLPSDHPPTIFLHGAADLVVPTAAVQPYVDALEAEGREVLLVTNPTAGHEWLPEGPSAIPDWFRAHP